ncbi:hypothetical protein BZARG_2504 [Bizionia argentinensis JUB59]|uniref:Right-handed parallel beta-helix repeat-containing protein n=1 Tax=Bizionia argentinensis JUB59 TaxID=1046627 RepID=G2EFM2_9FLAO|nr:hypothetical protein [Bizionia argentinensis]EGV42728.1 hypothetical protein BZARG_2504 [Bizionia argentinensis JUB59]
MKRIIYFLFCVGFLMLWSSCRKDLEFAPSSGNLEFSKDTVYLDTVFTNIGSSTYNLIVYNRSKDDISIPTIKLASGISSEYRLNVDGMSGNSFENVEILAKDSMYVFIETTIDINNLPNTGAFLYTDKIEFDTGSKMQAVNLVTLVKDAVFIYPNKDQSTGIIETLTLNIGGEILETEIEGRYLEPSEFNFTNQKPYVIYGYAAVPNGETLIIDAGARVHFHSNSGILVADGASINVNGTFSTDQDLLENEVIFQGNRLEPNFSDIPGQWGTIWLFQGSVNNTIKYATIKNAGVGIISDSNANEPNAKLTITNSQIYNSSNFGILGRNTSITAENVVINNSGQSSFAGTEGGKYNFTHCTIANYWNNSFRQFPALLLNNFRETADAVYLFDLTEANFNNCIIYGNDNPEFILDEVADPGNIFNFKFTNSLVRFQDSNNNFSGANYDFDDTTRYEAMRFNSDPDFKNTHKNKLIIGDNSGAIDIGTNPFSNQVGNDILNVNRTSTPDAGAYQHTSF